MSKSTRLLFVGDIALGGDYERRFGQGSSNWTAPFAEVRPIFREADLIVGNLEEPLYRSSNPRNKRNLLGASPESAAALSFLGFTALSLANNHITDQGAEGLHRTREILKSRGIAPFGAGKDLEAARRPAFVEAQGQSSAFLAYAVQDQDVGSVAATDSAEGCAPLSLECIRHDILEARRSVDNVVVSLHWGFQYDRYPAPEQITTARKVIDLGAVIVFGHHPHVLQGIERYKHGLIIYSLGNFFFPDFVRTDGLRFRFPRESKTTAAVLCNVGGSEVHSYSVVFLEVDRFCKMKLLVGPKASRQRAFLGSLSGALDRPDYEAFWEAKHRRIATMRAHQERRFRAQGELVNMRRRLRSRGLADSLKSIRVRHILRAGRLFRRVIRF